MNQDSQFVDYIMNYIYEHWPQVRSYVPADAVPLQRGFNKGDGLCTHPELVDEFWVHSRGGKRFVIETIPPDSFFWVGAQDRGGSEYFYLMWFRDGRRFWFYDQYIAGYVLRDPPSSPERTRARLDQALKQWETTDGDVIYSVFLHLVFLLPGSSDFF